jgi:hypothetical protein
VPRKDSLIVSKCQYRANLKVRTRGDLAREPLQMADYNAFS